LVQQSVIAPAMHQCKRLIPICPRLRCRPDDQLPLLDLELDGAMQMALLDDGFRKPDAPGIPDSYHACFHRTSLQQDVLFAL
jgi:hypothetical protein